MPSAFRGRFETLTRRLGLEPGEGSLLVLMGTLVAFLLSAYTIAKVLRDALFLQEFGALALPYAYIGVALTSAGYVWLENGLARRFPHVGALRFNQYIAIGCSILAAAALPHARHWTSGLFYLWTSSQAMMLLPTSGDLRSMSGIPAAPASSSRSWAAAGWSAVWPAAGLRRGPCRSWGPSD